MTPGVGSVSFSPEQMQVIGAVTGGHGQVEEEEGPVNVSGQLGLPQANSRRQWPQ